MAGLTVEKLLKRYDQLGLVVIAGRSGLRREIREPGHRKPGLLLTGHAPLDPHRIQVLDTYEIKVLASLAPAEQEEALTRLLVVEVPCLVVTGSMEISPRLLERADGAGVPILRTHLGTQAFVAELSRCQEEAFRRATTMHGVFVDVLGVGILIQGRSGVGKSEAALELILRGHRLVADDVVDVSVGPENRVMGSCSEVIKHFMEVRGLGIINIRDLFGVASVSEARPVELVIELVDWDQRREYDRLGLDEHFTTILDVKIPQLDVPVGPGRNVSAIVEVAARNLLLKRSGTHSAQRFESRMRWVMEQDRALVGGDTDETF